ncbi:hypothetical protein ATANTOWER_025630 [Ataeniobius toweri]|uniref:Uncharacterized protein n=1 Tax=Ataeniobius toweri TaxID=208326 RepID=A0ABU7BI93_9TELE|nr:hypothetical protein [Ataeniobius toweri]
MQALKAMKNKKRGSKGDQPEYYKMLHSVFTHNFNLDHIKKNETASEQNKYDYNLYLLPIHLPKASSMPLALFLFYSILKLPGAWTNPYNSNKSNAHRNNSLNNFFV